jgi:tetratricopeptide (TPR) repeat protein
VFFTTKQSRFLNYKNALLYFKDAESIYLKLENYSGYSKVLYNLLSVYQRLNQWQEAVESGRKAVSILERMNDRMLASFAYRDTASIYFYKLIL